LVFAFGQILSGTVLTVRPNAFLNIHPSPLPKLRGPSPLETALAEGWSSTGICLMRMARRMDSGPVAARLSLEIRKDDSGADLRCRAAVRSIGLLDRIPEVLGNALGWETQDESEATWSRIIHKKDGWIDFSLPAEIILSRARAFAGWPGTIIRVQGEAVRVADLSKANGCGRPGEVIESAERLFVACGSGAVDIGSLQRPTRQMLSWPDFRTGVSIRKGTLLHYPLSKDLVRHSQRLTPSIP